ncbi:MAG: TonB-dependent receptor, partial [Hyphomonadaceae bacterium]
TLHVALRGRHVQRNFGGTASAVVAPLTIGVREDIAPPVWNFGQPIDDVTRQWAGGAQYQLAVRGVGAITLGGQKVEYKKTITPPVAAATVTEDDPFFTNGALALNFSKRLIGYASFTQGLEEAPVAPENAVNAQEAPPAIHTEQYDMGLRYSLTPQLRLIVGYFNVQKPYFNLDPARLYRELGVEHHKGFEISLAGPLTERLNVVAGAVLQKPEVTGEGVQSGLIGEKPVSQPETTLRLNLDYRTPWMSGLSVDGTLLYVGERAATTREFAALGGRQLDADAYATLDLGMRYRFKINGRASTFRALASNVFNENTWKIFPSGAFYLSNPRNFQVSLATDF